MWGRMKSFFWMDELVLSKLVVSEMCVGVAMVPGSFSFEQKLM